MDIAVVIVIVFNRCRQQLLVLQHVYFAQSTTCRDPQRNHCRRGGNCHVMIGHAVVRTMIFIIVIISIVITIVVLLTCLSSSWSPFSTYLALFVLSLASIPLSLNSIRHLHFAVQLVVVVIAILRFCVVLQVVDHLVPIVLVMWLDCVGGVGHCGSFGHTRVRVFNLIGVARPMGVLCFCSRRFCVCLQFGEIKSGQLLVVNMCLCVCCDLCKIRLYKSFARKVWLSGSLRACRCEYQPKARFREGCRTDVC